MAFTKITNAELNSRGATTLPNVPTIGATALKQEFDAPAKNVVAPKVNNLIDELQASTAAADLGAVAPTGRTGTSVQSVLNSLSSDLGTAEAQSHSHPNKAVIDKFADDGTGLTYDGNPVGAVTSVNSQTGAVVLTASDVGALPASTPIPTKTSDLTNDSNFVADASYVHTDNNYDATAKAIVDGATAAIAAKSTVVWNQIDTTGTKIAEITIDGVKTDVKATGGGSADAYKTIDAGGQSFVASGADTFKINAGSNVTITALTGDKGIQISAAGGGTSTGDMLMVDYDPSGTVKSSTNGITGYVANAISGKADTSSLATVATSGAYADLTGQPTIPTITDTYSATSSNGMSGKAVAQAIGALDKSDSAVSGQYVSAVSETDGIITVSRESLPSDTKNTAGTTNSTSKLFLAGATTQAANPQTYSNVNCYASGGYLYSNGQKVSTDEWTSTATVSSSGTVSFSGLNDSYGYKIYYTLPSGDSAYTFSKVTKSGSGTSVTLTFTTDAPSGTVCKLRILK